MAVTDNVPQGTTDSAPPSTDVDNSANWDYFDPDDEQDNEKTPVIKGTEGEKDEAAESGQEAETADTEEDKEAGEEAEKPEASDADSVLVEMPDGEKLNVSELRQGYLRQSDYTRGKQDLANRVRWVDERAHTLATQMQAAAQFLQASMPQRPDPALAHTNVAQYLAMERYYEDSQQKLAQAMQMAQNPRETISELSEQEKREHLDSEREKMARVLPTLATEKGRKEFSAKLKEVGDIAGISEQELNTIDDHRYVVVLDLALEGLAVRKAKQQAKAKVANVPPVAPQKRSAGPTTPGAKNRESMQRLSRSGSIHDAMEVDFE